jgi:hypothetical protein
LKQPSLRLLWYVPAIALGWNGDAAAQRAELWNDARVLELVAQARIERHSLAVDPAFRSYAGEARGYVYFFIDRPDSNERTLLKADQVALELFWQAPNRTSQRIVGRRDERMLPTNIRYHLDHLTVVQDDFGDFIRLGDGDEVEQVLHPLGPGAENTYDFLLSDSLSITYGEGLEQTRVYEVRVRPKEYDRPGLIGSVFLDRATASIVRMNFTFTPASYVDPYLDYIRISLDNSLWDGKYWLPYRQEAELRRELPELDFMAGSIIRGRYEIGRYDFNAEVDPLALLLGRRVTALPQQQLEAFPFERGLFDDLDERGLAPTPTMESIRAQARQAFQDRYLSGLGPLRLYLGSASSVARYNRAEGSYLGAGLTARTQGDVRLRASAGYAIGRGEVSLSTAMTGGPDPVVPTVDAYWNQIRDLGPAGTASGLTNTLAAATGINDYLDPFFARGLSLAFDSRGSGRPSVTMRWERHESAEDVVSETPGSDLRPVRTVDEGILGSVEVRLPIGLPANGTGTLTATGAHFETQTFATLEGNARWTLRDRDERWQAELQASAGLVTNKAPVQELFLLGGRETLPGYQYRDFVGDRFWLVRAEGTFPLRSPWVSLHLFGSIGAAYLDARVVPAEWRARDSDGLRATIGAGLALGWDVLRFDVGRGLRDGKWELMFSVVPRFRGWL